MTGISSLRDLAATRRGIASVCTAHPDALRATLRYGRRTGQNVLIEATCNQVNQFGGYTGMTPAEFHRQVTALAAEEGLDPTALILGGDHLGPNPWRRLPADAAMDHARTLVAAYAEAGFAKIHLDASMGCAGEPAALGDAVTASRAAALAEIADHAARSAGLPPPLYVIGTEVPVPGGADHVLDSVTPTSRAAARQTLDVHRQEFRARGLEAAFERVIALVVQPGVEFGNANVIGYDPAQAADLVRLLDEQPGLVFEAHSTDYQSAAALAALVRDGFAILKVGPAVTFAWREALYGLDLIASELVADYPPRALYHAMEQLMLEAPDHWQGHYHDGAAWQRHYSYSDRIRYYWAQPEARTAVQRLEQVLAGITIPQTLISQFLPGLTRTKTDFPLQAIEKVLATYSGLSPN